MRLEEGPNEEVGVVTQGGPKTTCTYECVYLDEMVGMYVCKHCYYYNLLLSRRGACCESRSMVHIGGLTTIHTYIQYVHTYTVLYVHTHTVRTYVRIKYCTYVHTHTVDMYKVLYVHTYSMYVCMYVCIKYCIYAHSVCVYIHTR